jgi:hypothetical protein
MANHRATIEIRLRDATTETDNLPPERWLVSFDGIENVTSSLLLIELGGNPRGRVKQLRYQQVCHFFGDQIGH